MNPLELEKIQFIMLSVGGYAMQKIADQEAQFGGILKDGWYTNCSTPIVVHVRLFPCPDLDTFERKVGSILQDVIICWCDSALS